MSDDAVVKPELKFPENVSVLKRVEDFLAHFHDGHGKVEYMLSAATLEELHRKVFARKAYLEQNFPAQHPVSPDEVSAP